jgi:cytochrome c556
MPRKFKIMALTTVALAVAAAPLIAGTNRPARTTRAAAPVQTPASIVAARVAGFKELGSAFKNVRDGLSASELPLVTMQQSARQIKATSQAMYRWFPANSRPQPGLKTHAKAEIWTKPAEFRAAQDNFVRAADAFQAAVATGNADNIKAAARPIGGACKGCHDKFKVEDQH